MDLLNKIGTPQDCVIAVIVRDGKVLLGYRHYTPDKYKKISVWTCPGGRCDEGETIEQTVKREVAEEVGLTDLKIHKYLGTVPGAKEGDILHIFHCSSEQEPKLMEPEKFSEWKWVNVTDYRDRKIPTFNSAARDIILPFLESQLSK